MAKFTFIDLFAGIGGTRIAFENAGGECVFSCEKDKYAQQTYYENFGDHNLYGDIVHVDNTRIPDHDILVAGFPCQPFSLAGVSKNVSMSKPHGFEHRTAGTMFHEIVSVLKDKRPQAFVLENVKNLKSHNKGDTFKVIMASLESLGYSIQSQVFDSVKFVPQHRERIFIIGFLNETKFSIKNIQEIIDKKSGTKSFKSILDDPYDPKYIISDGLLNSLINHKKKHMEKGNGFGFSIVDPDDENLVARTLSARYYKDGAEILIKTSSGNPRKLSPEECKRIMGFPEEFKIPVSDNQAYKQFGNSVVVPLVSVIAKEVSKYIT